jgi:hypothetical protein
MNFHSIGEKSASIGENQTSIGEKKIYIGENPSYIGEPLLTTSPVHHAYNLFLFNKGFSSF